MSLGTRRALIAVCIAAVVSWVIVLGAIVWSIHLSDVRSAKAAESRAQQAESVLLAIRETQLENRAMLGAVAAYLACLYDAGEAVPPYPVDDCGPILEEVTSDGGTG